MEDEQYRCYATIDAIITTNKQTDSNDVDNVDAAEPTPTDDDSTYNMNTRLHNHDIPYKSTNDNTDVKLIELDNMSFIRVPLPPMKLREVVHCDAAAWNFTTDRPDELLSDGHLPEANDDAKNEIICSRLFV